MAATIVGYCRCSTDSQDLTAQRQRLRELGVTEDRIYLDHGLTGTNRARPGLDQALAALREGDTLVVPKLDRLARSVPDTRAIGDDLAARGIKLSLGGQVYDPTDPMGKMFFNILATFARIRSRPAAHAAKEWPSPVRKVASKAENRSYPTNNGPSCAACTAPATTPSPTSPNCSTSPDQPSTAPSRPWKLFLHNAAADNASSYFALWSASGASEHQRAVSELLLAVPDESAWCWAKANSGDDPSAPTYAMSGPSETARSPSVTVWPTARGSKREGTRFAPLLIPPCCADSCRC